VRRVYQLATGKYFKWAAADEILEPEFLRRCVEALDPVVRFREMLLIYHWCYQIFGVMRMSALRQLPPQGSYVNSDGVLLAQMSLLGRFYEVPEHLFINRHHSARSAATLPVRVTQRRFRLTNRYGTLPCPEWWDPAKTRALTFPEFRQLLEYFLSIYRVPLSAGQKLRCYSMLLSWIKIHFRPMLKDLLIAADQVLYNLQVGKTPPTDFNQEASLRETKPS